MNTNRNQTEAVLKGSIDPVSKELKIRYNGALYTVQPLVFQKSLVTQELDIPCIITHYADDKVHIKQNIGHYLRHYYRKGDKVLFKVKEDLTRRANGYYEVVDKYGFVGYVTKDDLPTGRQLYKNEGIYCRILEFTPDRPLLMPISFCETSDKAPVGSEQIREALGETEWDSAPFAQILLATETNQSSESLCHDWIMSLLAEGVDLETVHTQICHLLELSPLLNHCEESERQLLQNRLTLIIDQLYFYHQAHQLLSASLDNLIGPTQAHQFVYEMIKKIERSGFVYRAETNLGITMATFRLAPDLMLEVMPSLLRSVCTRGEDCRREPFRSSLTQLLELYIREVDETLAFNTGREELVQTIIQVLALQQLLAQDEDETFINLNVNRAKLYRYISCSPHVRIRHALNMAYASLIGRGGMPAYTFEQILLPERLIGYFSNHELASSSQAIGNELVYETETAKLILADQQISVIKLGEKPERCSNALPSNLNLWQDLSIRLPEGNTIAIRASQAQKNDINLYRTMWTSIEHELFAAPKRIATMPQKITPRVDQEVLIYVEAVDPDIPGKFHCRICEDKIEGQGLLWAQDIVKYNFGSELYIFQNEDGAPLLLPAKVQDAYDDGTYKFVMSDGVSLRIKQAAEELDELKGQIYHYDQMSKQWLGVSTYGYPIVVPDPERKLKQNSFVLIQDLNYNYKFKNITGYYVRYLEEEECDFDKRTFTDDSLAGLMYEYADGQIAQIEAEQEEEQMIEHGALLSDEQMQELMYCLDRIAHTEENYIVAFNYLGVAKVLANMLQLESSLSYYEGLRRLILLLHDFAINDRVNTQQLDDVRLANETLFKSNEQLLYRFKQLKIVSLLGRHDQNGELWSYRQADGSDQNLIALAELVLSHNLLQKYQLQTQAAEVHNRIKKDLRLQERRSDYLSYGVESQEVEFKTSLVYPAGNAMQADLSRQTQVILTVIASMLNSSGGVIYIGVNDQGLGVGIEEDLKHHVFGHSKDKYIRHIQYQVSLQLGAHIGSLVQIEFDKKNQHRDVCIIKVTPYAQGVKYLEGWPVRQGPLAKTLNKEEFDKHNEIRKQLGASTSLELPIPQSSSDMPTPASRPHASRQTSLEIKTSSSHSWAVPSSIVDTYLNILYNGAFVLSEKPLGRTLLSLEICGEDEVLVIAFEDGAIVCVPKSKFEEKERGKKYAFFRDRTPVFVSFARKQDVLIMIYESYEDTYLHCIQVGDLSQGDLSSLGAIPTTHTVNRFIDCDLVNTNQPICLDKYLGRAQGLSIKQETQLDLLKDLDRLGVQLQTK